MLPTGDEVTRVQADSDLVAQRAGELPAPERLPGPARAHLRRSASLPTQDGRGRYARG